MERRKEGSLHLSFSSFPSRAPFSHASSVSSSACDANKDHWAPVNPGQKPSSALTQLPSGEARQSLARWGHALSKIFFRYTVSSILRGSIEANFYYWNSTFVPFWNLCVQTRSPYLRGPGPKLLTVVCFSSSELLDYFRLHTRVQCSGNIEHSRLFLPPQKENHLPYYKLLRVDMCYIIATRWVLVRNNQ